VVLTRSRPAEEVVAVVGEDNLRLGDAADADRLEAALAGIDHVAFCAGGLLPAASERDPELDRELTLGPVLAVLAALRDRPEVTLTYLSSGGTVYGEPERLPVRESDPTAPTSTYGSLHLACEREIERARRDDGLRSSISSLTAARERSSPSCTGSRGRKPSTSTATARRSATTSTPPTSPARWSP